MNIKDKKAEELYPGGAFENITIQELPDELKQKISKAFDDYKSGNYITHEEMKQKIKLV